MKQYKIIQLYNATEKLAGIEGFTPNEQWQIYTLRKALRPHIEFQQEREKALAEKYTPYADENGTLKGEPFKNYAKEKAELNNLDVECEYERIALPLLKGITFQDIEALEDIIEFKTN